MSVPAGSRTFEAAPAGYAATVGRALVPVARRVVQRAALLPGERVLDLGTGTGTAAAAATGDGRTVVGVDGAPHMIEIARRNVPGARFEVMDFASLDFADGSFDVLLSSHALHFAGDAEAVLREWRRVAAPGGRLSLSVPGPMERTPHALYREIYERHGIDASRRYPSEESLTALATGAGWTDVSTAADPTVTVRLETDELFRTWRRMGSQAEVTRGWSEEQHAALTDELMAATPRDADGAFVIPFGALYLTARRPD